MMVQRRRLCNDAPLDHRIGNILVLSVKFFNELLLRLQRKALLLQTADLPVELG